MDFQDFIIEFAQDYGVILLPLCLISMVYIVRQLTSQKSSEQFGLGQASTGAIAEERNKITKRQPANETMTVSEKSMEEASDFSEKRQAIDAENTSHDDTSNTAPDFDEVEFNDDPFDESDDQDYVEEPPLDDEEAYGDLIDDRFNQQEAKTSSAEAKAQESTAKKTTLKKNAAVIDEIGAYIVMYLIPKQDKDFLGYELLQALANYHVHLSEKKHFQRFAGDNGQGELWYHVASMSHPGTFDMSEPGKLSCQGLVFILEVDRVDQLAKAYDNMLETCHYLADDLDGKLLDDQQQAFQENQARRIKYFIAKGQLKEPAVTE